MGDSGVRGGGWDELWVVSSMRSMSIKSLASGLHNDIEPGHVPTRASVMKQRALTRPALGQSFHLSFPLTKPHSSAGAGCGLSARCQIRCG